MNIRKHTAAIKARQAMWASAVASALPSDWAIRSTIRSAKTSSGRFAQHEVIMLRLALEEAGAEVLGEGAFSVVIGVSDRTVLKISVGLNDGYHKYAPWVIERRKRKDINQDLLKHLPVIYSTTVLQNGVRLTMMERLVPHAGSGDYPPAALEDLLEDTAERKGHLYDLHMANVMFRADGTAVATDPWAASTSPGELFQ